MPISPTWKSVQIQELPTPPILPPTSLYEHYAHRDNITICWHMTSLASARMPMSYMAHPGLLATAHAVMQPPSVNGSFLLTVQM